MSSDDSRVPSVSYGISEGLEPRRIMLLEIEVLVLTLISFSLTTNADIIAQPGYGKVPSPLLPIHSQSFVNPIQRQQESEFGHTQARLIPIYANGYQGGIPYQVGHPLLHYSHYPHYPHYPHYVQTWPRHAPQSHLRVLKIGGHKVFQPSWYVGQPSIPMAVHRRYKKSIEDSSDSGKSGETVPVSENSPVAKLRSDVIETKDKNVLSNDNKANARGLFNLDIGHFMNCDNHRIKLNAPSEKNTDENKSSTEDTESNVDKTNSSILTQPESQVHATSSQIPPDEPNLRNFPDPRPDTPEHKTSHKTTSNPILKSSLQEKPLLGIPGDKILEWRPIKPEYPTPSSYVLNYNLPSYNNYAPAPISYLPVFAMHYGTYNDDESKMHGDQQSGIQAQICQTGDNRVLDYPPNTKYVFLPQTPNYISNYVYGYPETCPCQTSYLQFQ